MRRTLAVANDPRPPAATPAGGAEDLLQQPRLQEVRRRFRVGQGAVSPDQRPAQQRLHLAASFARAYWQRERETETKRAHTHAPGLSA
eukprot:SAG31_NODE_1349_length_8691_cov_6.407239_8_plen_88_part_00